MLVLLVPFIAASGAAAAELQPKTLEAWNAYVRLTERRIGAELDHGTRFLAADFLAGNESRSARSLLKSGRIFIRRMQTKDDAGREIGVQDGMIHHWMGATFVPGVSLDSLIRWLQDYDHHQQFFNEVEQSKLVSRDGATFKIFFRLKRKKIITVVYNTEHTAIYRTHDAKRVSSRSFTTRIAELEDPGTPEEKEKPAGNDRGFLWRLNSYWRFQEEDGGVVVECESVSLSRAIPFGLGWLINGYVESVPRESLENTLVSIREGSGKTIGSGPGSPR
jgi:hypothetical protein